MRGGPASDLTTILRLACGISCLVACGAPIAVEPDAGTGPLAPAPPEPPTAPSFACPADFVPVVRDHGAEVCEPWPGGRPACARGELLAPGGCVPIADDCGVDAPPELAPGVALVRPGSSGGDGSRERPFGTISEAVASGATSIALAPGEHELTSIRGVSLSGTCPTRTTLRVEGTQALEDVVLRRVRVTGTGLVRVHTDTRLELDRVEFVDMERAIEVFGTLEARRVVLRDLGAAILAFDPQAIALEDAALVGVSVPLWLGAVTTPRASVSLSRVMIADVASGSPDPDAAVLLRDAERVTITDVVVEDAAGAGIFSRAGATTIDGLVVRRVGGAPLLVENDAELADVWVREAPVGIALGSGRQMATDLVVEDVGWIGLLARELAGRVERLTVARAAGLGVDVVSGELAIADLHVDGVIARDASSGGAYEAEAGARAVLTRALLERSEHFGLVAADGATVTASDVEIGPVAPGLGGGGYGALALVGAHLELARASIHDVHTVGLAVQDATGTAEDLRVERVSVAADGVDGVGVIVARYGVGGEAAALVIERAEIVDTVRWGVLVSGEGASLEGHDVVARGVRAAPCGSTCGGAEGGAAVVVDAGGRIALSRFVARDAELAGFVATAGIDADLTAGRIEANAFGLILSPSLRVNSDASPGIALHDLVLAGNRVDQHATEVDVPDPGVSL